MEKSRAWKFCKIGDEIQKISQEFSNKYFEKFVGISREKFLKIFMNFLRLMSLVQFFKKSVKLVTRSWEVLIFRKYSLKNSQAFLEKYSRKFSGNSSENTGENLRNYSKLIQKTLIPYEAQKVGDQFQRSSHEFPRNQSQKFARISSKQVTKTGKLGEISHFCYLGGS